MDAISRIDRLFSRMWHFPLSILCGFSGKGNFFWAKLASFVAGIGLLLIPIVNIYTSGVTGASVFFGVLFVLMFALPVFLMSLRIHRFETSFDFSSDALPASKQFNWFDRFIFGFIAIVFCPSLVVSAATTSKLFGWSFILIAATLYWEVDYQPPKKSWVKAGIEKLAKLIKRIHFPVPTPTPIPT